MNLIAHMKFNSFRKVVREQKCPVGAMSEADLGPCQTSMMQLFEEQFLKRFYHRCLEGSYIGCIHFNGFMKSLFTLKRNVFVI